MDKVDITLSVLLDNAVIEYEKTTEKIMQDYKIPVDLIDIALEKILFNLRNQKIRLYSNALMSSMEKTKSLNETVKPNTTTNN